MEDRPNKLRELRVCRFCLTEKEPLTNIYVKDKQNAIPLPLQIMACVALEVFANDGMPQLICDNCRTQTRKSYTFKTICKRSDDALKLYLATGILKRGSKEIEMNKTVKRTAEDDVEVTPSVAKRKKTPITEDEVLTEESTSEYIVKKGKSDKTKQDKNNSTVSDKQENVLESTPPQSIKSDSTRKRTPKIEIINQVIIKKNETIEQTNMITENQVIETIAATENMQELEKPEGEQQENQDNFSKIKTELSEVEEEEPLFEPGEITDPFMPAQPKVPQVATQCFPCTCCERSFPLQQLLDIHMRQHTRERKFSCKECDKKFFSKHDLAKHCQVHTGDKPFTCVICDKSFSRATLLHRHEKIHISVPKYLCTYCDKTYLASDDLDAHMRTHKKNRPYQCSQCEKRFAFKQGLERHEIVHSNEHRHKCNYCEESFTTPSKLQRHIQCHAGARPYPCKLCPRTFLLSHHLSRHLRNHYEHQKQREGGEHKCDVCSMSFKRRFSLINHSAIHSMVNLKCVICNKEFDDAESVKGHITSHLSGLPYLCYRCEYSFENEEELMEHEQKHYAEYESAEEEEDDEESKRQIHVNENTPRRRSLREKKAKTYVDFLKDEDFSESDENVQELEEEPAGSSKTNAIQPVIRSETMRVYKGVKNKDGPKTTVTSTAVVEKPPESPKSDTAVREPKSRTKITTLETLGLSKTALEAMTDKTGFVEMKVGQKVIRVQKLMMTKADVQAMAEQGKIEMKGTKVVVKNSGNLDMTKFAHMTKGSPSSPITCNTDDMKMDPITLTPSAKGVRTYVKKFCKKGEQKDITAECTVKKELQKKAIENIVGQQNENNEIITTATPQVKATVMVAKPEKTAQVAQIIISQETNIPKNVTSRIDSVTNALEAIGTTTATEIITIPTGTLLPITILPDTMAKETLTETIAEEIVTTETEPIMIPLETMETTVETVSTELQIPTETTEVQISEATTEVQMSEETIAATEIIVEETVTTAEEIMIEGETITTETILEVEASPENDTSLNEIVVTSSNATSIKEVNIDGDVMQDSVNGEETVVIE